jgi:hypothetical protein
MFATLSDLHKKNPSPKRFGYVDNGPHRIGDSSELVLISVATLLKDFGTATADFMEAILSDPSLRESVDSRINKLLNETYC